MTWRSVFSCTELHSAGHQWGATGMFNSGDDEWGALFGGCAACPGACIAEAFEGVLERMRICVTRDRNGHLSRFAHAFNHAAVACDLNCTGFSLTDNSEKNSHFFNSTIKYNARFGLPLSLTMSILIFVKIRLYVLDQNPVIGFGEYGSVLSLSNTNAPLNIHGEFPLSFEKIKRRALSFFKRISSS